jgi:hypothetical protein
MENLAKRINKNEQTYFNKKIKLENIRSLTNRKKFQNLINVGPLMRPGLKKIQN